MFEPEQLNRLYQYCYTLTNTEADAYDLLQTALEKCLRKTARQAGLTEAYARTVIRHQFIDQYRKQIRFPEESFDNSDHETLVQDVSLQPLEDMLINEQALSHIWSTLSVNERELLYLLALEGYSIDEIAKTQQCPRGTLLARLHRLRKKLKTPLKTSRMQGVQND